MIVEDPLVISREGNALKCTVCARRCYIENGKTGFCGIRKNINGRLDLVVYSRPSALGIDPIEKKPFFHFLPGTNAYSLGTYGCTLLCRFCQNWRLSQAIRDRLPLDSWYDIPPDKAVEGARLYNCDSIAYTYNEPIIWYEYIRDISRLAVKDGRFNTIVTCGYGTPESWDAISEYMHAANIDLKGFNKKFYMNYCGAMLQPVMDSIKKSKKLGIWTEVTTLVIPGKNDDRDELRAAAEWLKEIDPEMPWHLTAFHPDYKMLDTPSTQASELISLREMALDVGLKYVYVGNVITPFEDTFCPNCGEVLIERKGFMVDVKSLFDREKSKCLNCSQKIKGVWTKEQAANILKKVRS